MISAEDLAAIKKELLKERARILAAGDKTIEDGLQQNPEDLPDFADQSSFESDRNFMLRMRDRERKLLAKIDQALERIEDGTFGICDNCGEEIGLKRLIARPVVTLCVHCKELQEKQEKFL
ncbi:MAG: RNA polymerase-binding protein DksA [bacterium]|nr:RNA polymerase-binding protein DksA [bacterium]